MVIVSQKRRVNRIPRVDESAGEISLFAISGGAALARVYVRFIATLKLSFKFDRSWSSRQAGGRRAHDPPFPGGRAPGRRAATKTKRRCQMFQGHIDQDTATQVEASAIPDVLFERGLYWASGRSGVVNLVAARKWFNLAALKGRADAIRLRREVAELMSELEIATAQREARAWMTAH